MPNNSLNVSLPTSVNGGAGLNLNLDFGGNTETLADGAYSFLQQSFATDNGFLGGSISGTQAFLANQTAPVISAAAKSATTYTGLMPDLFKQMFSAFNQTTAQQNSLASATISTQNALGQASIAVSKKATKSGGLCFITTAVCEHYGLRDDCSVLTLLRAFRDDYMLPDSGRALMVAEYYDAAPAIVAAIAEREDRADIYQTMRDCFLFPAVEAITYGRNDAALIIYCGLFQYAKQKAGA